MAASCAPKCQSVLESIISEILEVFDKFLNGECQLQCSKIARCRRLGKADILLPIGSCNQSGDELKELCHHLMKSFQDHQLRPDCCQFKDKSLLISLHRPSMIKSILQPVFQQKNKYGFNKIGENKSAFVWCGVDCRITDYPRSQISLDELRSLLLATHLIHLLKANGYETTSDCGQDEHTSNVNQRVDEILETLKNSKYLIESESAVVSADTRKINMSAFVEDNNISLGKNNYSINLKDNCHEVNISRDSVILKQTAEMANCLKDKETDFNIHVVPQKKYAQRELSDLLWRMVYPKQFSKHAFCVISPTIADSDVQAVKDIYGIRLRQVENAFAMRGKSENSVETFETVTDASFKFELLSTSPATPVKLNTSDRNTFQNEGIFVLYNFGRIQSVLDCFKKAADNGLYPRLPPFEEIDTSLLTIEEEWRLIVDYVAKFPSVVKETSEVLLSMQNIRQTFPTTRVCNFLHRLSADFSRYYSRVHILGESASHLHGRMFARILLLFALKQIYENCFQLLDILPPSYI